MEKVNLDTIRPWITKRITEFLGMEDEIVNGLIFELLNNERVRQTVVYIKVILNIYNLYVCVYLFLYYF